MIRKSTSTRSGDREIVITRRFDAPRELVFRAWTDPRHIRQWWGPQGFSSDGCEIDLRPGGTFRLEMLGPDGVLYPCEGRFREVVVPERLVYEGPAACTSACGAGIPPRSVMTVTFATIAQGTELTIHTVFLSETDREAAAAAGVIPGWESTFERLDALLAESAAETATR